MKVPHYNAKSNQRVLAACSALVQIIRPTWGSEKTEEFWDWLLMSAMGVRGAMVWKSYFCQFWLKALTSKPRICLASTQCHWLSSSLPYWNWLAKIYWQKSLWKKNQEDIKRQTFILGNILVVDSVHINPLFQPIELS